MARRRKRKFKWQKIFSKRGQNRLTKLILWGIVFVLVGYGAYEVHQVHQRQLIVQKQTDSKQLFIKQIAPEAEKMDRQYQVPASITIAQAILESDWGSSTLSAKYYNLFGVKSSAASNSKVLTTKEYINGKWLVTSGRFRVYTSWNQSIDAHALLMVNGTSDNPQKYAMVRQAGNYQQAASALQSAGYATDPNYATKLIHVIETYHLDQYDQ